MAILHGYFTTGWVSQEKEQLKRKRCMFLPARCPSCWPTNSVKWLKASYSTDKTKEKLPAAPSAFFIQQLCLNGRDAASFILVLWCQYAHFIIFNLKDNKPIFLDLLSRGNLDAEPNKLNVIKIYSLIPACFAELMITRHHDRFIIHRQNTNATLHYT